MVAKSSRPIQWFLFCGNLISLMNEMKNKKDKTQNQILRDVVDNFHSETDTLGSYTGLPCGKDKTPMQDADDL